MAFITETLAGDKRIQLGNEEFMRAFSFGNNWNQITVAWRMTLFDRPVTFIGSIAVGVCKGAATSFLKGTVVDFIGITNNPTISTYTRLANNSGFTTPSNNNAYVSIRKVGGTALYGTGMDSGQTSTYLNQYAAGPGAGVCTITRSPAGFTGSWGYGNATSITRFQSLQNAEGSTNGFISVATSTPVLACGDFYDTLNISWANSVPVLEISDVTVARIK